MQIDKKVLVLMTDAQLARYIPTYGDRLATVSFCHQQHHVSNRESILERIKEKLGGRKMQGRKMSNKACSMSPESPGLRQSYRNAEKLERKVEVGWLHCSGPHYTQVRTRHGGGTRSTTVGKETTVKQLMDISLQLFFPSGLSTKGPQESFEFEMCDFKRISIPLEETVGKFMTVYTKLTTGCLTTFFNSTQIRQK